MQEDGTEAQVTLLKLSGSGIERLEVAAGEVLAFQERWLSLSPDHALVLNADVQLERLTDPDREAGLEVSEQLLFSGKEELGLSEWQTRYPEADGRGTVIAVVDDGVSLARPGLERTSTDQPKILGFRPQAIEESLTLTEQEECRHEPARAIEEQKSWKVVGLDLSTVDFRQVFELSSCGIAGNLLWDSTRCPDLGLSLVARPPRDGSDELKPTKTYAGLVIRQNAKWKILVDFNSDRVIHPTEILEPFSQNGTSLHRTRRGTAIAFDISSRDRWVSAVAGIDNPTRPTPACDASRELGVLSVKLPETARTTGAHGEGVASIAAGYRIGGRAFDGVAPGAQLVDVQIGERRLYTVGEIVRALETGGRNADIVNLSYSLYFATVEAQVAMSRLMELRLAPTNALYLFSAGNNGPGRSSMNRGMLYPSFGIVVGAFLNGRMSQSTFGSASPMEGVATYSSRGPGLDGGTSALVLSPLAGLYMGPVDGGLTPFSGTSSATPALSGFLARVVSRIRAENLKLDPRLLRQALIQGSRAMPGVPFVDQGHGLPNLLATMDRYRELVKRERREPELILRRIVPMGTRARLNPYGVDRKGVLVRGSFDRDEEFRVTLGFNFGVGWRQSERDDYSDRVRIVTDAPWLNRMEDMIVSTAEMDFSIRLDYSRMQTGENLSEVKVVSEKTGQILVIPVSVFLPHSSEPVVRTQVRVPSRDLARTFLQKPHWATHMILLRESATRSRFCGRFGVYAPNGIRLGSINEKSGTLRAEQVYSVPFQGVYELVTEGRGSHTSCPEDQEQRLTVQWIGFDAQVLAHEIQGQRLSVRVAARTQAPRLTGEFWLRNPMLHHRIALRADSRGHEWSGDELHFDRATDLESRLAPEVTQRMNQGGGYFSGILSFVGAKEPLTLGRLSSDGSWSRTFSPGLHRSAGRLVVTAFDDQRAERLQGPRVLPSVLALEIRESREDLKATGGRIRAFELNQDEPLAVTVELSGHTRPESLGSAPVSLECELRPDGFSVPVPCGALILE